MSHRLNFLHSVIKYKRKIIAEDKKRGPLSYLERRISRLQTQPLGLASYILGGSGIIAEIKRRSPMKKFPAVRDVVLLARDYEKNGASAISVLTDEKFFGGSLIDLQRIKDKVNIPVLRKDFIIDRYQVYQARAYGADAILLICSILTQDTLRMLIETARSLRMDALVEIHNESELHPAIDSGASIIGINNRNLSTLSVPEASRWTSGRPASGGEVEMEVSRRLLPKIPTHFIKIVESGIKDRNEIKNLRRLGADGFLIGDAILSAPQPMRKLREIVATDYTD
ncbi:MAG: indole-3-glycerol phosphate synthase TrpC [Planctomycetota bacterium]|nr:indole-3-glycerol phosphate synthase TrpC [Planctomycetota bacterium]MDI6788571.1 indole-3-glycerol phosphate synthase TrpC [Planctomycetota bacterium]